MNFVGQLYLFLEYLYNILVCFDTFSWLVWAEKVGGTFSKIGLSYCNWSLDVFLQATPLPWQYCLGQKFMQQKKNIWKTLKPMAYA